MRYETDELRLYFGRVNRPRPWEKVFVSDESTLINGKRPPGTTLITFLFVISR